jgi:hypothetical protein
MASKTPDQPISLLAWACPRDVLGTSIRHFLCPFGQKGTLSAQDYFFKYLIQPQIVHRAELHVDTIVDTLVGWVYYQMPLPLVVI